MESQKFLWRSIVTDKKEVTDVSVLLGESIIPWNLPLSEQDEINRSDYDGNVLLSRELLLLVRGLQNPVSVNVRVCFVEQCGKRFLFVYLFSKFRSNVLRGYR